MKTIFKLSIAILISSCIVYQYDWVYGNTLSKHLAKQEVQIFLLKNLKGKDYEISKINKSIKNGGIYLSEVKIKGKEHNETFIVHSTETSVVYHTLRDIPPLKKAEPLHYSTKVLGKIVAGSFVSLLISGVWVFFKKTKKTKFIIH